LHLGFLLDELVPVFVQGGGVAATQQHVFPLLDLDLELQIGLVDLAGRQQLLVQQALVGMDIGGEKLEAAQGDQQHQ